MENVKNKKRLFVENELKALLMKINNEICNVVYQGSSFGETVSIYFLNDYIIEVNVACDSLQAICEDVLKRL